jgi:hypothetical protein
MIKIFLAAAALWCLTDGGVPAEDAMTGTVKPFESVPFAPDRDVACLASALETGDPLTGPSTWILKARPGCVVAWHSHTAEEQLIVVRGAVMAEMTDHPPTRLGPAPRKICGRSPSRPGFSSASFGASVTVPTPGEGFTLSRPGTRSRIPGTIRHRRVRARRFDPD